MTFENIGVILWDFIISIGQIMGSVWTFLTTEQTFAEFSVFGLTIIDGFTFTPIEITGVIIILIVTAGLISLFSPL